MAELSLENSKVVYKVLRSIYTNGSESYGKEIERSTGISQGQVGDSLRTLKENNFVEKGKRKQAQYYKLNLEGIEKYIKEEYGVKTEALTNFVEEYVDVYLHDIESSTIGEMLSDDLISGLVNYFEFVNGGNSSDEYENLFKQIVTGNEIPKNNPTAIMVTTFNRLE